MSGPRMFFRQNDSNYPFIWEDGARQPAARWHALGEGPAQYLSDTPDGAWAEFLRHEEIKEPISEEEVGKEFKRTLWMIEIDLQERELDVESRNTISKPALLGNEASYAVCQDFARMAKQEGYKFLKAPSAALEFEGAGGFQVKNGKLVAGPGRSASVYVYFGIPTAIGWRCGSVPKIDQSFINKTRYMTGIKVSP